MSTDEFHDDHELLDEEDEQQAFLRSERRIRGQDDARDAYQGFKGYSSASSGRRNRKTKAAKKELVHEMEEGGPASRSSSSDGASDYEREKKSAFLPLDKVCFDDLVCHSASLTETDRNSGSARAGSASRPSTSSSASCSSPLRLAHTALRRRRSRTTTRRHNGARTVPRSSRPPRSSSRSTASAPTSCSAT